MEARLDQLDGLRGLAIILVILCHGTMAYSEFASAPNWDFMIPLGGSGVSLFFVLSGFLISGLLLQCREQKIPLRNFYGRRALKIVPAYYFCLIVYTFFLPALYPEGNGISGDWLEKPWVHFAFLSNFYYFFKAGFASEAMSVSWSLAIEEQFYLIWPILFVFFPRKILVSTCLLLVVAAIGARFFLTSKGYNVDQIMVFTPARIDSFALGGLIALAWREDVYWKKLAAGGFTALLLTGAGAIATHLAISYSDQSNFIILGPFSFLLSSLFYASLLVVVLSNSRFLGSTFLNRELRAVGKLSYSIYLTHLGSIYGLVLLELIPAVLFGASAGLGFFYLLCAVSSIAVGWLLFIIVENPALKLRNQFL